MQVSINLEGKRGTKYELRFTPDTLTSSVFIELHQLIPNRPKRVLASGLEERGGIGGRLLAGWFGEGQ